MLKILTEIQRLQNELGQWSTQTFGHRTNPSGPINHLKKEVEELAQKPLDPTEYADCLLLLLDAWRIAGGSADQLVVNAFDKLAVNKQRDWGAVDGDGVVEHVRQGTEL